MGRAVAHGQSIYMNTAIPGQIWALKANTDTNLWTWEHAGNAYSSDDPGLPINPPRYSPAPAPAPAEPVIASPAGAPTPAGPTCAALIAKAEKTKGGKGMFLGCQEFRYYGSGVLAQTAPYGCHCASWTVNCPFETCPIGTAFDEKCLSADVKKMGFTALSKLSNYVNPASVPKALRKYAVHPDYISTCMYWLPKPANSGLPAVNADTYSQHLPDFGTLYFDSVTLAQCSDQIADEGKLARTEANLIAALGQKDLSVISITCGSMSALVTGPKDQLAAAAEKAKGTKFCWFAVNVQVCTVVQPIPYVPPMMMGPSPGPSPFGPASAPSAFMPLFMPGAPAPAMSIAPVFTPMAPMWPPVVPAWPVALAPGPAVAAAPFR